MSAYFACLHGLIPEGVLQLPVTLQQLRFRLVESLEVHQGVAVVGLKGRSAPIASRKHTWSGIRTLLEHGLGFRQIASFKKQRRQVIQ